MTYRIHRFSYRHLAREVGAGGTKLYDNAGPPWVEDTPSTSEPVARLYDDQTKRQVTAAAAGIRNWRLDMHGGGGVLPHAKAVSRLILPSPHSLRSDGVCVRIWSSADASSWSAVDSDGAQLVWSGPPGDLVYDFTNSTTNRYLRVEFTNGDVAGSRARLGEWVWTTPEAPTTGVVHSWEHPAGESNADQTVMMSGDSFAVVRGQDIRAFEVEHAAVSGADLALYDALFRAVGTHTPFWYEHSDSAGYRTVALDFSQVTGWTDTACTSALATGIDGTADNARQLTSSSTAFAAVTRTLPSAIDLRGKYISFDMKCSNAAAFAAVDDLLILLQTDATAVNAQWSAARPLIGSQLNATWYRIFIDPTESAQSVAGASGGTLDMSAVDSFRIGWSPVAGGDTLTLDNLLVWDAQASPVRCRFVQPPERTQDNRVPAGAVGPSYTIRMRMIEVTG